MDVIVDAVIVRRLESKQLVGSIEKKLGCLMGRTMMGLSVMRQAMRQTTDWRRESTKQEKDESEHARRGGRPH